MHVEGWKGDINVQRLRPHWKSPCMFQLGDCRAEGHLTGPNFWRMRGNKRVIRKIGDYLNEMGLEDRIILYSRTFDAIPVEIDPHVDIEYHASPACKCPDCIAAYMEKLNAAAEELSFEYNIDLVLYDTTAPEGHKEFTAIKSQVVRPEDWYDESVDVSLYWTVWVIELAYWPGTCIRFEAQEASHETPGSDSPHS